MGEVRPKAWCVFMGTEEGMGPEDALGIDHDDVDAEVGTLTKAKADSRSEDGEDAAVVVAAEGGRKDAAAEGAVDGADSRSSNML